MRVWSEGVGVWGEGVECWTRVRARVGAVTLPSRCRHIPTLHLSGGQHTQHSDTRRARVVVKGNLAVERAAKKAVEAKETEERAVERAAKKVPL